jgi:TetR/AcrR family transcriptional regulator, fatty acid metabolism regulator protein
VTAESASAAVRERLMAAALEVMRERGFFRATGAEIADRAGMPEAAIWKHFGSKYDLCLSVLAEPFEEPEIIRSLPAAVGIREPRDVLLDVAEWVHASVARLGDIYAGALQHPETRDLVMAFTRDHSSLPKALEAVAAYVAAEQAGGGIPARIRPDIFAQIVVGTSVHHAQAVALYGHEMLPRAGDGRFVEHLVDGLLA